MDFIFQSGEFYGSESSIFWNLFEPIVTLFGILAAALISIYVFWKGEHLKLQADLDRLNGIERFTANYIQDLSKPLSKQIDTLAETIKKLSDTEDHDHAPQNLVNLHTKGLAWINKGDLFRIYIELKGGKKDEKLDLFREFNGHCDYIDAFEKDLKKTFDFFTSKFEKYEGDWNEALKRAGYLKDLLITEAELKRIDTRTPEGIFIASIDEIFHKWSQQKNYMLRRVAIEYLITPAQKVCREARGSRVALDLIVNFNDCLHANDNIDHLKKFVSNNFGFMKDRLALASERLQFIVNTFNNLERINQVSERFIQFLTKRIRLSKT